MGERDAFGREIDEDPLADLGWKTPQSAAKPSASSPFDAGEAWSLRGPQQKDTPAAGPAAPPQPTFQAPPPPPQQQQPAFQAPAFQAPRVPRTRRRRGGFARLIFVMAILVIVGASATSLISLAGNAVDRGEQALRDAIPTTVPPVTRTEPADLGGGSLLVPATLRKAVAKLPDGRVTVLTVRQDGLDATITADGQTTLVHMGADGDMTTVNAPVAIPGKSVRLDPAAPGRIVRTVTRRTGRAASSISQLVLANGSWTLQFPDGVQFTANAKGTKVRRLT